MRPPECAICDERFDPFGGPGGLVAFARDPDDADWYARAKRPGFVGHPPHEDWFCGVHAELARAQAGLTRRAAMRDLRVVIAALAAGALRDGAVRVVVFEEDGRTTVRDFADAAEAEAYADDVAAEAGEGGAVVTDGRRVVARGRRRAT
jgi:hypothetical protein